MFDRSFLKKNILFLILDIFLVLSTILFVEESLGRAIILAISFLIHIFFLLYTKNPVYSSILYILITLPFNITYQLPEYVEILSSRIHIYDAYINGIFVNYLVPTISIVDIGIFLFLFSTLFYKGITFLKNSLSKYKIILSIFVIFLIIQNVLLKDFVVVINSFRFVSIFLSFIFLIDIMKENGQKFFKKNNLLVTITLLLNTLIQGFIGIMQFTRGTSLALSSIGESQVVAGMSGSSFIELNDQLFLRAYGTFPHPNIFAGFLIFSSLVSVIIFKKNKGWIRYLNIMNILFCFVIMFFTFSRVGIFLIVLNIFIFVCKEMYSRKIFRKKTFSFFPIFVLERFVNLFNGDDSGWRDRKNLMEASFKVIKENIILGTGFGNFVRAMENYVPRTSKGIMLLQPVHNIFLLLFSETGIIGFLLFSVFLFKILRKNIKKITILGIVVFVDLIVIGLFDHYLLSLPQGLVIFFSLIFLIILESYISKKNKYDVK